MSIEVIIYLIGMLNECLKLKAIIGCALLALGLIYLINIFAQGELLTGDIARKLNVWCKRLVVCFLVLFLVPSQKTAYMMLGAHLGKEAIQSETAQKIQKIVSIKLDEYLKELEK